MPSLYNNALDDEPVYERVESFGSGMDAFQRSTLIAPDACQYLENVLIPDNFEAGTRPGADKLGDAFAAKIQGAVYFDIPGTEHLIVGTGGNLHHWNGTVWAQISGATLTDADVAFSAAQGVDKMLFTDGTAQMRTWNGTTWSAALGSGDTDPPVGATILLWHAGRMWAAGFTGGASGKEDDAIWCSALLQFGTGDWDRIGRQIRIGGGEGDPIVGLASIQEFTMAVLKQNSIWLMHTDPTVPITDMKAQVSPETVSYGVGCVGKRAFCVYGNDLLFVSPDKSIRSLQRMQGATGQWQLSAPLSLPIQPYVDRINWTHAHKIAAVKYREFAMFSVPLDSSTVPNYVFVWNGRLQQWVGIWSGWTANSWAVTRFGGNTQRLVHGDNVGNVRQWKDFEDSTDDDTYLDDSTAIATKLWTRSFLFGEPLNDKDAFHAELRFGSANAVISAKLMTDGDLVKTWTEDVRRSGVTFPLTFPVTFSNPTNIPKRRGLRGLEPFSECFLKIESTSGWWRLRSVSLSAFVNCLRNE